jgi:fucose permease
MHASYGLGASIAPLVVTALLSGGLSWRRAYGTIAVALAVLAFVFLLARRIWEPRLPALAPRPPRPAAAAPQSARGAGHRRRAAAAASCALIFTAVETGIESGAGIWGYVFLTSGRGLPHETAALAVPAYWATVFAGRVVLGPVADHLGPSRVLAGAVAGVALGAALMAVLAPGFTAVVGMMTLGVAAAPVFPLLTITTAQRMGAASRRRTARAVSLQVAASTIGSAALPAVIGLAIGAWHAAVLAPSLLVLALAMGGCYGLLSRLTRQLPRPI